MNKFQKFLKVSDLERLLYWLFFIPLFTIYVIALLISKEEEDPYL